MKKKMSSHRISWAAFAFAAALIIFLPVRAAQQNDSLRFGNPPPGSIQQRESHPKMESVLYQLMEVYLTYGIDQANEFAKRRGIDMRGDLVRVVAEAKSATINERIEKKEHDLSSKFGTIMRQRDDSIAGLLQSLSMQIEMFGGEVETSHRLMLQSSIPLYALQDLANLSSVKYLRLPKKPIPFVISEGVAKTDADEWQAEMPYRSTKVVKVCILDIGFQGYEALLGTELPSSVTTRSFRADGDLYVSDHGTACAEIVHDMAPDAELLLVNFGTDVEYHNAVNWIIDQGVDVVSCSVGWLNLGAGDGTGPICEDVKKAHNNDIIWVSASGNNAQTHWEGPFKDPDSDWWCNFEGTGQPEDEWFAFYVLSGENYQVFLSWDDWGIWNGSNYNYSEGNDYDLFLYDSAGLVIDQSNNDQTAGAPPTEAVSDLAGSSGWRYIRIYKWLASRDCKLELFFEKGSNLEYSEPAGSLAIPADSPYAVAVGATDWSDDSYHLYSSQGPTSDGRIKPDLVAPSGVSCVTYGNLGFFGTSASTPHVAGAFALLKGKLPYNIDQIKAIIEARALDLGSSGKDNIFGIGRLKLSKENETEIYREDNEATIQESGLDTGRTYEPLPSLESKPVLAEPKSWAGIYHQKDDEESLEQFLNSIELEPWNPKPCFEVAKIYLKEGKKKEAILYLKKYLSLGGKKEAAKELLESLKNK
jgi:hypothetical protein